MTLSGWSCEDPPPPNPPAPPPPAGAEQTLCCALDARAGHRGLGGGAGRSGPALLAVPAQRPASCGPRRFSGQGHSWTGSGRHAWGRQTRHPVGGGGPVRRAREGQAGVTVAPTHRPGADAPVSPSSTGDTLGGHPAADTCWLPLRPAAQQGGCTPGQTRTAAAAAAHTALSGRDQGQDGHRPPPSPEHFADCLKHHFAAESGFGGLAEQSPVCGEAAVVPQHGRAAQRHRRRAGGHSARSRPPCLTGSQLTRPMRTREGGSGRTQSCSFSRPRGPSPAQRGRVSAAFKLAPLGGGGGGPIREPRVALWG